MPTFYNFRENGIDYSFDDIFVPADLFRDGTLWAWGNPTNGRLGNAVVTAGSVSTPITTFAGGTNWKQVSCGGYHVAAIKTDGTLWTWGQNNTTSGKLGNGVITGDISTPVTTFAGGTNWKQVSCGNDHTAAIKTDGTLWTWGNVTNGRLGNLIFFNIRSTPLTTFAGGTNWKQVSCGNQHTAAIKTDGTLWTWGSRANGRLGDTGIVGDQLTPITTFAGGTNWKQVTCFGVFGEQTAAIKTDGTLWTWGRGNSGQLGNAALTDRSTPVTTFAGGTNWNQVSGGNGLASAIKTDGSLWTWGDTTSGKLGNAVVTAGSVSTPITTFAGGTNWKQVASGNSIIAAIKTDGTLWTWGDGGTGRLGNATVLDISTPVTTFAGGTNWKQVSSSGNCAAVTYEDSVL